MTYLLTPAAIDWEDGTPLSTTFEDIYWHRGAALEEKRAVFVDAALSHAGNAPVFTIAELGFGFGINCLLTAQHWPRGHRLNLVSIEKHPVPQEELRELLKQYGFRHTDTLLEQYPPPCRGQHVIWLSPDIRLLLIFEDVNTALSNLDAAIDFWYLDGFAPARNQEMWADDLYRKMFARSRPGTGVATYSAASAVRRGLAGAGFEVTRSPGYGRKKEMLRARRPGTFQPHEPAPGNVLVVGAGLAGRACAEALSRRGHPFTLVDSGAPGPSTITQLAMFPQLALAAETRYRFSLTASQYMQSAPGFYRSGMRWFGRTTEEAERLVQVQALFPDDMLEAHEDCVVFHHAGWVAPRELPDVDITHDLVTGLTPDTGGWQCALASGQVLSADIVILATGFNRSLVPEQLQVRAIRGQAVSVKTDGIRQVLNGRATIFPTYDGRSVISGTYARSTSLEPSEADTRELVTLAQALHSFDPEDVRPMVGIRAVSRDRLPVVGQAPDWQALQDINRVSAIEDYQEGLYYCTAFGSRGATHARLCAEHLVSKMSGEPAALGRSEQEMLSPARFVLRDRNAD